jgi:hypothetical protein
MHAETMQRGAGEVSDRQSAAEPVGRGFAWQRPPSVAWVVLVALVGSGLMAWAVAPVHFDDAFISYVYAENLAVGEGLVFNHGERVEGYSNFLWVLALAMGRMVGIPAPFLGPLLGVAAFLATLVLGWWACWCVDARESGVLAGLPPSLLVATLVTGHGVASTAGNGLESAFFGLLVALSVVVAALAPGLSRRAVVVAGLVPAALFLTRPDGLLPAVVLVLAVGWWRGSHSRSPGDGLRSVILVSAVPMLVGVIYGGWKIWYFGAVVPNTYHAKGTPGFQVGAGLAYLGGFVATYPQVVVFVAVLVLAAVRSRGAGTAWRLAATTLVVALLYGLFIVKVGGDFMEYRMALHIVPALTVAAAAVVGWAPTWPGWVRWAIAVLSVVLSMAPLTKEMDHYMQDNAEMDRYRREGARVGRALQRLPDDAVVATTLIGTIRYHSGLRIVDQWGLVDPAVRERPEREPFVRGHLRFTTLSQAFDQGARVYLEHPHLCRCEPSCVRGSSEILIRTEGDECVRAALLTNAPFLTQAICEDRHHFPFVGEALCLGRDLRSR